MDLGGTALMVLRLMEALRGSAIQCDVCTLDGHGALSRQFGDVAGGVYDLSGPGGPVGAFGRFVRLLRRERYDLLHLYGLRVSVLGRTAARFTSPRPVVVEGIRGLHVTEGEDAESRSTRWAVALSRAASPFVDAYLANSPEAVRFLTARGLPREKFLVIPNGIRVDEWAAQRVSNDSAPIQVLCVANFRPVKRHVDLVQALAILRDRSLPVRCTLVGHGSTRPAVEALIQQKGLTADIRSLGPLPPELVREELRRSDVFVLTSLWEGMPGSIMEAMAAGLPVVGTDVPGIRDLVVDGVTGILVPARDPERLASALETLARNHEQRRHLGAMARKRAAEFFSFEKMVERHARAYVELSTSVGGGGFYRTPAEITLP